MTTRVTSGLTPEQVEARRAGIGGSDAAAVLGVDPYRTPNDIYEMKLGLRGPVEPNAAMKRGIVLEPIARKLYRELTSRRVRRAPQHTSPAHSWMLCNVDGIISASKETGHEGPGVLEIKCPGMWTFAKIEREGLPMHWIVQMHHNLIVTDLAWGSFAIFSAELWRMIRFDVSYDFDLATALVNKEERFWTLHVVPRVPPPAVVDTTPELMAALAKAEASAPDAKVLVRNDGEWGAAARMALEARELVETAENLKASATDRLKALMGDKGAVEGGGIRVYWSARDGRVTFDKKALAKAHPEIDLTKFEKQGAAYEDFRLYPLRSVGVGD